MIAVTGKRVAIAGADGRPLNGYLARPETALESNSPNDGDGSLANDRMPGLLVIHEIVGLTEDICRITRRFAAMGLVAFAPDLFDGGAPRALCVVRTLVDHQRGSGRAFDHLEAARSYLAQQPDVDARRIGVAGFCMGGGFALLFAARQPLRVAAPFYGQVPKNVDELRGICPVIASYGGKDRLFAPLAKRLEHQLQTLGVKHDVVVYPNAGHAFMSEHDPGIMRTLGQRGPLATGFDDEAAEASWTRMSAFFEHTLFEPARARPS